MSIELMMPSNHLILCRPLLLLPSIFASIRVFSNESAFCIRCGHPGLISFRMDWLDLFSVQGTLKSLLQHHSSKASILWCSAFFIVQLSHPYMTYGKTGASTTWTFVGKVMPLLFNTLSRLVITFLPRSKLLLISWLQSPSAVILEPLKIKFATVSTVSPSISYITLPTKVHVVKAMAFPVVMYGCESWTIKKTECQRIDAFELWSVSCFHLISFIVCFPFVLPCTCIPFFDICSLIFLSTLSVISSFSLTYSSLSLPFSHRHIIF